MAGKSKYTELQLASFYVALQSNGGNVKRTARQIGMPEASLRRWRDIWEATGPPDVTMVEEAAGDFLGEAERVREKALRELERKIPQATPSALVATVGMLTDKIALVKGLATSRTEHVHALPPAEEIRAVMSGLVQGALEAARIRELDVIDAELVDEQAPLALVRAKE